ncbi:hypothetical protein A3C23_01755 [Candidatus Roizmanbacteria bacterium RIFCSPHIGHO2_02_FULL_37_13b]|uniref:Transaldolase n=1 Tax=Candidatus Roizmanbacteria bacterium RIFCSPLOWO2_02_FULL_36_11 TaxID=1802071 RepID=A0A1F7JCX9_9BACT|nr:MAG: hypothetical protein A3C23_01755 [Candidatus Roizmanbacteria bacterium RIFCSPHIGHO2_02_FULL_37_13b]OGK53461.1 MAG: hypothetical protein A3H78_02915 [Candidatus Roizmanbacteria bacterium RIFCSPLOWO2_02_FULL_36_11]
MKKSTPQFNRSIFIDSSDLDTIKKWNRTGVIDGVTTNQVIMLADGVSKSNYAKVIKAICLEMKGMPVSVELTDSSASEKEMVTEAKKLNGLASNIVVKVPLIPDTTKSLAVIYELAKLNIAVNVTLMMTFEQMSLAILAARHCKRTSFVSLFWGRTIEDFANYRSRSDFMAKFPRVGSESEVNKDPKSITEAIVSFLQEGNYNNPRLIVGSIRTAVMVGEAFASGGHIVTVSPDVLQAMLFSQRTIETMQQFDEAWIKMQKK